MTVTSQRFRLEGTAIHLARHLAEAGIEDLLGWSCQHDDVTIELAQLSLRVSLRDLKDTGRIRFHAIHRGPGKERTWSRRIHGSSPQHIVERIIADANAIRDDFSRLSGELEPAPLGPGPGRGRRLA